MRMIRFRSRAGCQLTSPPLITKAPTGREETPNPTPPACGFCWSPPPPAPPAIFAAGEIGVPSLLLGAPPTFLAPPAPFSPVSTSHQPHPDPPALARPP